MDYLPTTARLFSHTNYPAYSSYHYCVIPHYFHYPNPLPPDHRPPLHRLPRPTTPHHLATPTTA